MSGSWRQGGRRGDLSIFFASVKVSVAAVFSLSFRSRSRYATFSGERVMSRSELIPVSAVRNVASPASDGWTVRIAISNSSVQ